MQRKLPKSPVDVWNTRPEILDAAQRAKLFGWWDFPLEGAATDSAEMDITDRAYWFYKSANPITRTSQAVSDTLFINDQSSVRLPDRFRQSDEITLSAVGDLIQANGLEHSKDFLFDGIEDVVFDVDISFANYESPVADETVVREAIGDGRSSMMCCSFAQYSALTQHKRKQFAVLNLANNHSLDLGLDGLQATRDFCMQQGAVAIGVPSCIEDYGRGTLVTKRDTKLGFVSATFGLNGKQLPEGESYRIHASNLMSKHVRADLELLRSQIRDCKAQGSEFIVASIHWGFEFEFFPRFKQIEIAHTLVEEGVDLILGHHPHVIQPIEYYRTKRDPNRVAVIAYSLGSLTWDWYTAPHLILSTVLNLTLAKGILDDERHTYIASVTPIPVFRNVLYRGDKRLMRIEKLREHLDGNTTGMCQLKLMERYVDLISNHSWLTAST